MKFRSDADIIVRRRKRLRFDYDFYTQRELIARSSHTRWRGHTISQYFAKLQRQFLPHYFVSPPRWRVKLRQIVKDRALPDFCVIGPKKSGSSDLAITIMSHPNVLYPLVKELPSTDPLAWKPFYPTTRALQRHVHRHGVTLCALVQPCLQSLDIPTALSCVRPDTKIVINLRNPTEMVFSQWKWFVLHKDPQLLAKLPFLATFSTFVERAIEVFPEAPLPFSITLHYAIYANSVAHWLRTFGERNVRIFDVAEYFANRNTYLEGLEKFLGLPHAELPQRLPVINRNPLEGLAPAPETSARLRDFFEPYNRRLWRVIGATYSW